MTKPTQKSECNESKSTRRRSTKPSDDGTSPPKKKAATPKAKAPKVPKKALSALEFRERLKLAREAASRAIVSAQVGLLEHYDLWTRKQVEQLQGILLEIRKAQSVSALERSFMLLEMELRRRPENYQKTNDCLKVFEEAKNIIAKAGANQEP